LDLVDGEEGGIDFIGQRLDRADPEAWRRGHDLLFPGDQRDLVGADTGGDAVVDLARQQPERQADHAAGGAKHPRDGGMGLAGIGGAEDGDHIAATDRYRGGRNTHPYRAISVVRRFLPHTAPAAPLSSLYHSGAVMGAKSWISGISLTPGTSLEQNRSES